MIQFRQPSLPRRSEPPSPIRIDLQAFVAGVLLALERLSGLPPGLTVGLEAVLYY